MYRRFNLMLLGWAAAAAAGIVATALWLQPAVGDLARLGGYAENEYGWNGTETVFSPPLAEPATPDGHYDIVVIGDSFSLRTTPDRQTRAGGFWTDFLAAETGLRVGVFDICSMPVERLLASPGWRNAPPPLLILEMVERDLRDRLVPGHSPCPAVLPPASWLQAEMRRPATATTLHRAAFTGNPITSLDQAADYLGKNLPRWTIGIDHTLVRRLTLTRSDLFSSRRPDTLLFFYQDLYKRNWSAADWQATRRRLLALQNAVQANGTSTFMFLMVPDKSSAYAPWLPPADWQVDSAAHLAGAGLHLPRLDLALRTAIAAGTRDVYLPDDTHWGSAGARIAADLVAENARRVVRLRQAAAQE